MVKVLVVGQTPPPYLGQPIMLQRLLESNMADVEFLHVGTRLSTDSNEVGRFRVAKVLTLLPIIARIWWARLVHGVKVLYYPPAGPIRVTMFRDFAILLPTRWLFSKTIFHFHASGISEIYERLPAWQRWLFRCAYYHPAAGVRLSETTPDDARRLRAKCEYVIPYGIDDPCPAGPRTDLSPVTAERPLRILFVAMLRESKGLLVLIEAAAHLAARGVPFQFEVMGQFITPEFGERVQKRVEELGLQEKVKFLGMLTGDEKFAAYARADVFSLPTFYESEAFPVVLLEALANGLPIVSTRWRGIPSLVDDGETGFLVETHDPEAVAARLSQLAGDTSLRVSMARAARRRFLEDYTLSTHIARMREMFLEVSGETRRASDEPQTCPQEVRETEAEVEALT
ncbi:MAG TPA: glycosyltransferase [Pirellulales bacterium]|nr:glycosyltransferase [Pirellulales bacterium]